MVGTCRVCGGESAEARPVTVGSGDPIPLEVCRGCVRGLQDVPWVDVSDTGGDVRLAVAPEGLARALEEAALEE
jgi:hypothetical protein